MSDAGLSSVFRFILYFYCRGLQAPEGAGRAGNRRRHLDPGFSEKGAASSTMREGPVTLPQHLFMGRSV